MNIVPGPDDALPTFNCFDDAVEFVLRPPIGVEQSYCEIVHGIIRAPSGARYAHAWVEQDDHVNPQLCWQAGMVRGERIFYAVLRHRYFGALANVRYSVRYKLTEAVRLEYDQKRCGPWDPYIRAVAEQATHVFVDVARGNDFVVRIAEWPA